MGESSLPLERQRRLGGQVADATEPQTVSHTRPAPEATEIRSDRGDLADTEGEGVGAAEKAGLISPASAT